MYYERKMINKKENYLEKMAKMISWALVTLISASEYITDIRPFFNSLGAYFVGVLDGIVMTMAVFVVSFYSVSKFHSCARAEGKKGISE